MIGDLSDTVSGLDVTVGGLDRTLSYPGGTVVGMKCKCVEGKKTGLSLHT